MSSFLLGKETVKRLQWDSNVVEMPSEQVVWTVSYRRPQVLEDLDFSVLFYTFYHLF